MVEENFNFKHISIHMGSIKDTDSKKTNTIKNDTEVKQSEHSFNKCSNNQFSTRDSVNLYSLHDPFDLNLIHGLRKRLFITFNEFSSIIEDSLLPPVLESVKKVQVKIKECDQLPNNYIFDLNSLIFKIKIESKNDDLHKKNNKTNISLRKFFQIKLIKCYKIAINATELCAKTLKAGIRNPIHSKMKNLIQIISTLSLTTGKYIYGKIYKEKKKESFDLVQKCKDLENMLEKCGYKDIDNDNNYSNNIDGNILNELSNKALSKPKIQSYSANSNRLTMYNKDKPKLGSCYDQGYSKKSVELTRNKVLSKKDNISNAENNLDNVKTVIEEFPFQESNETNYKLLFDEIQDEKLIETNEVVKIPTTSKVLSNQLKTTSNVGLYIVKENIWRNFPIKNIMFSQNGSILLNITPGDAKAHHLYRRQFKQQSLTTEHDLKIVSNITESIIDDLIHEALSKMFDEIIQKLILMELYE